MSLGNWTNSYLRVTISLRLKGYFISFKELCLKCYINFHAHFHILLLQCKMLHFPFWSQENTVAGNSRYFNKNNTDHLHISTWTFLSIWNNYVRFQYDTGWNFCKAQDVKVHILTASSCQCALISTQNPQSPFRRLSFENHHSLGTFHHVWSLCGVQKIKNSCDITI